MDNIIKFVKNQNDIPLMTKMLTDGTIPDINIRYSNHNYIHDNYTALEYQTLKGTLESMKFLLTHKPPADPNLRNNDGDTALHLAVFIKDPDKVRLLLDFGADKTIKNMEGYTPLGVAKYDTEDTVCFNLLKTYTPQTSILGGSYMRDNNSHKNKYLKYKKKYLELKSNLKL